MICDTSNDEEHSNIRIAKCIWLEMSYEYSAVCSINHRRQSQSCHLMALTRTLFQNKIQNTFQSQFFNCHLKSFPLMLYMARTYTLIKSIYLYQAISMVEDFVLEHVEIEYIKSQHKLILENCCH